MARRYSESSTDSWSLVERRSSVESSDEEEAEIVTRDVYDEYDNESIGQDSMEDDTDFTESESEEEALEDAVEQEDEEEEGEEEDVEVETIHEEEALADSAARHFVAAEKVVERLDELADCCDSPMEEALFTAVSTPERMRLFVVLSLTIVGCIVLGLERSYAANMNLITPQPQSEFVHAGLPSREYVSRIGVAEVREFLDRRQLLRTPPKLETYGAYEKAFLKKFEERRVEKGVESCTAVYYNTTISIRSPTSNWSQCSQADAPVVKPAESSLIWIQMPNLSASNLSRKAGHGLLNNAVMSPPRSLNMGTLVQQLQPKKAVVQPKKKAVVMQQPKRHLQPKQLQPPCIPSAARPCKPSSPLRPTKVVRPVRPTKTLPIKPTTITKTVPKYSATSKSPSLSVYRNYSVMRVYQDRSSRRDPKPFKLPNKSLIAKKPIEKKKKTEAKGICQNTVLDRMKKRREQQKEVVKKMNKRSVPPPVIYANGSAVHSKALMRKSSFAAGHCDRRNVQELRPLPCISYKEQLPCLAPSPRRLISGISKKKPTPAAKTTTSNKKVVSRSPKKEYIRRIPLV